ncbi:MAG: phage portal protein [Patescibacteria group bacterium]|nr:phage portal protein [Patescibacteria group bacterium]
MVKQSPLMSIIRAEAAARFPTFLGIANKTAFKLSNKFPKSNTLRKFYHGVRNWYEAGWPIWTGGNTSYLPSLIQDARWDGNYVTRREAMRRMRYWSQNSGLVESILDVGERYTVGTSGLNVSVYPNDENYSADSDDWYDRAEQVLNEWHQECGWNGESMAELLSIGYRDQKVDGETFYIKTRKVGWVEMEDRKIQMFKPCLQIVEAHRVETPFNQFDEYNLIDGVQFKITKVDGRDLLEKVGYWVRNGMGGFEQNDSWNLIKSDDIFHIRNMHRANQYRSITDFYSVEQDLHKFEDFLENEMKAQFAQGIRAVGIESNSGQAASPLDPKLEAVRLARGVKATGTDGQKDLLARYEMFRKETGAYVYGLKTGEKVHFDSPVRPSEATLNLFELLTNRVCAGTKSPRTLVFNAISGQSARPQGTQVRAELDNADIYYKKDFRKWKSFVLKADIWFLEWAIQNDYRVADAPPDWKRSLHICQPEACNVDVGYTTQSNVMMLSAGLMDYEMILNPMGTSFMQVAKRLLRQQKWMEKQGLKVTLPALLPGQIPLDGKQKETVSED